MVFQLGIGFKDGLLVSPSFSKEGKLHYYLILDSVKMCL